MCQVGIDIGTTTITVLVVQNKELLEAITFNNQFIDSTHEYEKIQDPNKIYNNVLEALEKLLNKYNVTSIGITGQMHGILYVDYNKNPISSLYTWCDKRSNEMLDERTYCKYITDITGYTVNVGYGLGTHYYNMKNGLAKDDSYIMTIHDYVAYKLSDISKPLMHSSDAASLGLYDLQKNCFDKKAFSKLGMNYNQMPEVTTTRSIVGKHKGIDVYVAIGDNQASYLGATKGEKALLFNVGTGSQISLNVKDFKVVNGIETRPYINNDYLLVGASICGGKAFEALAKLFQEISGKSLDEVYSMMVSSPLTNDDLVFETTFSGTRLDSTKKGSLNNLTLDNFHKDYFVNAMLKGMTNELYDFYKEMGSNDFNVFVGAGNGLRKNPLLQKIVSKKFGMDITISSIKEEAAYGAALFAERED